MGKPEGIDGREGEKEEAVTNDGLEGKHEEGDWEETND